MAVAVIIPCYRVKNQIEGVIRRIPADVGWMILVDDACPEKSTQGLEARIDDSRLIVIRHEVNQGVGGAMLSGYRKALELGSQVVAKIDGDGQMDPALLPHFILPIEKGQADYVKGNRFYRLESLKSMPGMRLFGNAVLSFIVKLASGYWNIMDPTNGYTVIHRASLSLLDLDKLDRRYFFESDMLFRLGTLRAVVRDVPMNAHYGSEQSSLSIGKIAFEFPFKYLLRFLKRIFYLYFLRSFHFASLSLVLGTALALFGGVYGTYHWWLATIIDKTPAATGVIMLAAVPFVIGFQLLLTWAQFDMSNEPKDPLQKLLE